MKNISAFLILIVFIPSVLLGYWAGLLFELPERPKDPAVQLSFPVSFTPIPTMPHGQSTMLLLHPDEMSTDRAQPVSIWLLTYFTSATTEISLIPIYPSISENAASINREIRAAFGFIYTNGRLAPAPPLIQALEQHNYSWGGYIILDDTAIQKIFALVGMNAPALSLDASSGTASPSMYYGHVQAVNEFCNTTHNPDYLPDWEQMRDWPSEHFVTNLEVEALIADLQSLTVQPGGLRCTFPTIIQDHQ